MSDLGEPKRKFSETFSAEALALQKLEPVKGKTYVADGWQYRDIPRMSPDMWDYFVGIIGDENFVPLSMAEYGEEDAQGNQTISAKRGQLLISPDGMENLRLHTASKQTEAAD